MKMIGKSNEGKYSIQYTTLPGNYETTLNVLDTDYTSFAVIWACNRIAPIGHTGNNVQTLYKISKKKPNIFFFRISLGNDTRTFTSWTSFTKSLWSFR